MGPGNFRFFNSSCSCQREGNQPLPSWTELRTLASGKMFQKSNVSISDDIILLMEEILHQLVCQKSHYLQGFIHPRWCRISSINSIIVIPWQNLVCSDPNDSRKISAIVSVVVLPNTMHVHLYIYTIPPWVEIVCIYKYDIHTVYTYRGGFSATY